MPTTTAILLGASGSVGQALLAELLRSPKFSRVIVIARRPLDAQAGAKMVECLVPDMQPQALTQAVVDALKSADSDAVGFSVLGVGAGTAKLSLAEHRAIDVDLNAAFAKGLKDSGRVHHLAFMSAVGADVQAKTTGSGAAGLPRYARVKGEAEPNLTEDEIKALISQGAETGAVGATEENIVQRVFQLGDQRVAAIMTPRPDIEWIDVDATEEELREFLASHSHTQFVVCHGGLDDVLGIVRSADLLPIAFKGSRIELRTLTKEALFVPDSMPAVQLLESFRSSHKHVALVMDEYGAVEGLVTITDLLTAIVGDLPADASEAQGAFVSRADGSWLVDGAAAMEDVTAHFGMDNLPEDEAGTYHTIGGFVMARLGRVPKTADTFEWGGMKFEVIDMDGRRIDKVLVTRNHPSETADGK